MEDAARPHTGQLIESSIGFLPRRVRQHDFAIGHARPAARAPEGFERDVQRGGPSVDFARFASPEMRERIASAPKVMAAGRRKRKTVDDAMRSAIAGGPKQGNRSCVGGGIWRFAGDNSKRQEGGVGSGASAESLAG
jgi:hypothetical protein